MSVRQPNYNCADVASDVTGECARAMYSLDSMKGQCASAPHGTHWNYAGNAIAQNRCYKDDATTHDFLAAGGPVMPTPEVVSPENKSRFRNYFVQVAAPAALKNGSLSGLSFGGMSTGQYARPDPLATTHIAGQLVPGGLASKSMHHLLAGRSAAGLSGNCPPAPGFTNCAAEGYPWLGAQPLGQPPGVGNGCVHGEDVECGAYTQLNMAMPPASELMPPVQPYPPNRRNSNSPPPHMVFVKSQAERRAMMQQPIASFAPLRPVNLLSPSGYNTSMVQFAK